MKISFLDQNLEAAGAHSMSDIITQMSAYSPDFASSCLDENNKLRWNVLVLIDGELADAPSYLYVDKKSSMEFLIQIAGG